MDEVAPVTVNAEVVVFKTSTFLCLVLGVVLVVLTQLVQSMGELASLLVRTVTILHKLLAELRFELASLGIHRFLRFLLLVLG